jgi:hypothetical protein
MKQGRTMTTRTATRVLGYVVMVAVAGCGGGGSGGGSGGGMTPPPPSPIISGKAFAPSTGPGDTQGYFPLAAGNQWQYDYTTSDPNAVTPSAVVTQTVSGTKSVLGVTAMVLSRADPTNRSGGYDSYFGLSPGGVTDLGNTDSTDNLTPQLVPYVQELFPIQLGNVSTLTATNLPDGNDQAGHVVTLNMTQGIANVAFESVDAPAGTYANALRQTTTVNGTVQDNGQSAPLSGTETSWYVPGVGLVKDLNTATGGGVTLNSSAELRFFTINGTAHGLGSPQNVSASAQGGVSPAIASDGSHFLIVSQQYTGAVGAPQQQNFIGTLVNPDGSVASSFNVTQPTAAPASGTPQLAVVGFDGTNYLIVYETDHTATSQPKTLSALVVSPSGATVAGPNTIGTVAQNTNGPNAEALVFDGTHYLLIYFSDFTQLSGVFITPATAQAAGASQLLVSGGIDSPAVAFDGTNYLVAWDDAGVLNAARVSGAGALLDTTPLVIAQMPLGVGTPMTPTLTFDGTNYLVAYRDYRNEGGDAINGRVSAARVSRSLTLLDGSASSPGIHVTSAVSVPLGQISAVYMQGAHWLVWATGTAQAPYASRVSPAGAVPAAWADGFPLALGSSNAILPVITASGPGSGGYAAWVTGSFATTLSGMRIYSSGP